MEHPQALWHEETGTSSSSESRCLTSACTQQMCSRHSCCLGSGSVPGIPAMHTNTWIPDKERIPELLGLEGSSEGLKHNFSPGRSGLPTLPQGRSFRSHMKIQLKSTCKKQSLCRKKAPGSCCHHLHCHQGLWDHSFNTSSYFFQKKEIWSFCYSSS